MENIQTIMSPDQTGNPAYQTYEEPRSEDGKHVSESLYWEAYYDYPDRSYEWNNGYLEEKPVSDLMNVEMGRWFLRMLDAFLETYPLAKLTLWGFGFRLALPDKVTVRKPDIGIVLNDNPISIAPDDNAFSGIFDLCVELIGDQTAEDIRRDTVEKKSEYKSVGVREYCILDARGRHMAFYRLSENASCYERIRSDDNGVIRSGVLPGFQFREADLIRQPSLREMAEDRVYRNFVLPYYQAEKRRAEKAEQRAEKERQRAELEKELRRQADARANAAETELKRLRVLLSQQKG